jgi:hypothetical protein
MKRQFGTIAFATALVLAPIHNSNATLSQAEAMRSLAGLTLIPVVVEELDSEAQADGLTRLQIQTECELRLRRAGIVVPVDEQRTEDQPYLYVYVNVFPANSNTQYIYNANLEFRQRVSLLRSRSISVLATTWNTGTTGIVLRQNLKKVQASVAELMDEFMNAYLAANPKK